MKRERITDSYHVEKEGLVALSGCFKGFKGHAGETLEQAYKATMAAQETKVVTEATSSQELKKADICLQPFNEDAKSLIKENFDISYVENEEGYLIDINDTITVYANSKRAALYAAYTIRDICAENGEAEVGHRQGYLQKGIIYNYPAAPHRAARVYLPSKKDMPYFKKFINMLVHMGYNTIWLEIGGAMEFKRHPEINKSWEEYCRSMQEYHNKPYVASRGYYRTKNSVHTYNGGGEIYSQQEMRDLVAYCNEREIEVIPEVPSLTHSEYFLISHPDLRECDDEPYAATACPSNPDLYPLVFDLYDEIIEVFQPKTIHIGHDEWWVMCVCDRCKDKDPARLFADNVLKCYEYLKARGVQTMMWADKLHRTYEKTGEAQGGCEKHLYSLKTDELIDVCGEKYPVYKRYWFDPPKDVIDKCFHQVILDTADCMDMLPDDIIYVNWLWACEPRIIDDFLSRGKTEVFGNCCMEGIWNCRERFAAGAKGLSVSNWIESTEAGFQNWNALFQLGYCSTACWGHQRQEHHQEEMVLDVFDSLYRFRNRETLQGSYVEVVHTVEDGGEIGKKYYMVPYVPEEQVYMGKYLLTYADGRTQEYPILYGRNISNRSAGTGWYTGPRFWAFKMDYRLTTTASVCNIEKREDGIWYKTVFPVDGEVVSCEYVPDEKSKDYVTVDRITVVQNV